MPLFKRSVLRWTLADFRSTRELCQISSRHPSVSDPSASREFWRELLEENLFLHVQKRRITAHHCPLCCVSRWSSPLLSWKQQRAIFTGKPLCSQMPRSVCCRSGLSPFYGGIKEEQWSCLGRWAQRAGCAEAQRKSRMLWETEVALD